MCDSFGSHRSLRQQHVRHDIPHPSMNEIIMLHKMYVTKVQSSFVSEEKIG